MKESIRMNELDASCGPTNKRGLGLVYGISATGLLIG